MEEYFELERKMLSNYREISCGYYTSEGIPESAISREGSG